MYCAPDDFDRLAGGRAAGGNGVPVIKVHGSVGRAATMVDTLRQRVLGRPKALEDALARLFRDHAVLVVGFSGADLAYDPQYLGLREARRARRRSPWSIARATSRPRRSPSSSPRPERMPASSTARCPGASRRGARAGRNEKFVQPGWDSEMEFPGMRRAGLLAGGAPGLGESLSPVRAAVVLALIAEAAGSSDAAYRLLTRTMPFHIKAGLQGDPAMPKQLCMIAATLIEACHVDEELSGGVFEGGTRR